MMRQSSEPFAGSAMSVDLICIPMAGLSGRLSRMSRSAEGRY
jgi:hypothetical protein